MNQDILAKLIIQNNITNKTYKLLNTRLDITIKILVITIILNITFFILGLIL